jgi:cell division septation protein DedD
VSSRSTNSSVVQVASYTDARSAEALVQRLHESGYEAYVSDTHPDGQMRFRVRVRPGGPRDVNQLAAELGARGYSVWITRE